MVHWLIIALIVSLGALLLAVAGVVRHVRLQHAKLRAEAPAETIGAGEESD